LKSYFHFHSNSHSHSHSLLLLLLLLLPLPPTALLFISRFILLISHSRHIPRSPPRVIRQCRTRILFSSPLLSSPLLFSSHQPSFLLALTQVPPFIKVSLPISRRHPALHLGQYGSYARSSNTRCRAGIRKGFPCRQHSASRATILACQLLILHLPAGSEPHWNVQAAVKVSETPLQLDLAAERPA
jgi:hypothetical protein